MLAVELLKGVVLATGTIVLVVAFGATIKPVADGSIGASDAVKFMGIAVVPMLQYALPFGACMAATLGYHRFASENESVAASAGGISYGTLIAPAIIGGALIGALLLGLTGHVAPRFTRVLESIVTKDAARTLIRQIERGESVTLGGVILHADEAFRIGPEPGTGALDYFILKGVVAAAVDEQTGNITADVASQRADVWLYPFEQDGEDVVAVIMRVTGGVAKQEGEALLRLEHTEFGPWVIPGAFGDSLDFKTDRELRAVLADPESYAPVTRRRAQAAAVLAQARARSEIIDTVRSQGQLTLTDPEGGRLALSEARLAPTRELRLIPEAGSETVGLTWRRADGTLRQQSSDSVDLGVSVKAGDPVSRVSVELHNTSGDHISEGSRESLTLGESFTLPADPAHETFGLSAADLLTVTDASEDPAVRDAGGALRRYIVDVEREATANRHQRAALSLAGFIMTPLGATMALRLREKIPLHVYLWSFFPALTCVLVAAGGASYTEDNGAAGLYILWAGCAFFALFAVIEFIRLRRH